MQPIDFISQATLRDDPRMRLKIEDLDLANKAKEELASVGIKYLVEITAHSEARLLGMGRGKIGRKTVNAAIEEVKSWNLNLEIEFSSDLRLSRDSKLLNTELVRSILDPLPPVKLEKPKQSNIDADIEASHPGTPDPGIVKPAGHIAALQKPIHYVELTVLANDPRMRMNVSDLELPPSVNSVLREGKIHYVAELIVLTERDLEQTGLGAKDLDAVIQKLAPLNLKLGTNYDMSLADPLNKHALDKEKLKEIFAISTPMKPQQITALGGTRYAIAEGLGAVRDQLGAISQALFERGADELTTHAAVIAQTLRETPVAGQDKTVEDMSIPARALQMAEQTAITVTADRFEDTVKKFAAYLRSPDPQARKNLEAALNKISNERAP